MQSEGPNSLGTEPGPGVSSSQTSASGPRLVFGDADMGPAPGHLCGWPPPPPQDVDSTGLADALTSQHSPLWEGQ